MDRPQYVPRIVGDAEDEAVVNRRWLDEHGWERKLSLIGPSGLYVAMTVLLRYLPGYTVLRPYVRSFYPGAMVSANSAPNTHAPNTQV